MLGTPCHHSLTTVITFHAEEHAVKRVDEVVRITVAQLTYDYARALSRSSRLYRPQQIPVRGAGSAKVQ